MPLFDRQYRLIVGQPSGAGRSSNGIEITDLRVQFNVTKTLTKNPNNSEISIYNLNPAHRELVEKPDTKCEFYAGYSEDAGPVLLFQGDVRFASTPFEIPDIETKLELGDGLKSYRDSMISLSYGKGIASQAIIREIASRMGLAVYISDDLPNRLWDNGFSFFGAARKALDKVVAGSNSQWSIQNGVLQVIKQGGGTSKRALVLSADSGMIGSPQRMRKASEQVAEVTDNRTGKRVNVQRPTSKQDGWKVRGLLMPSIGAGDTVKLESRTIESELVVSSVTHRGDSHDGDWQTEMELVTYAAAEEIKKAEAQRVESATKAAQRRALRATKPPTALSPASQRTAAELARFTVNPGSIR